MPPRILIIEDEAAHAEAVLRSLEGLPGAEVRLLGSLQEFREQAEAWRPDIALMDLNLPDGRAIEVLGDPTDSRLFPIVVMTSYGSEQTAVEAMKAGAWDYLVKSPEAFSALPQTFERLLTHWQVRNQGKRMHRELKASEAKFRSLTEHSTDLITRYDAQFRFTYLNPAALTLLRLEAAAALGKTPLECGLPKVLAQFLDAEIQKVFQTAQAAQAAQAEVAYPDSEGGLTLSWRLAPEFDAEGTVHSVLGVARDITERQRAEEALREAHQFNEQIIQSAQEGVIVYGLDLRYQVWNAFMERLSGLPASEVLGKHPLEMPGFPKDAGVYERLERALAGEAVGSIDFPYLVPATGKSGWTTDTSAPFRNSKGEIIGVIGTVSDITERKQAEDALRASEELFAKAFSTSPDAIAVTRLKDGIYRAVNEGFTKMTGYSEAEVLGQSSFSGEVGLWADPLDRERMVKLMMEQGEVTGFETLFKMKDGRLITGLVSIKFIVLEGELNILSVTRDITERKLAEAHLRESEAKYRSLVETAQELVWKCDTQGRFTYLNPAWETSHGYRLEEMLGRGFGDFQRPEVVERDLREFGRHLAGGSVKEYETTQIAKDGRELTLLFNAVPLMDAAGNVIGTQGTAIDITDRRRAEAERAHLEAQLQHSQKMESLGLLAGGIAHDMNNVLGAILGLATAHLELHPEHSPAHRAFDTIVKASTRGGKLVKGLLSISRKGLAEEQAIDVNALVQDEVHLLERTTLARVRLEMDLAPGRPLIRGDAGALSHALMNLCVNAVDAMPDNGRLILRTRSAGDQVELEVEDNGCGMPPDVLEKALEPFFTTKPQGKGTGLGLSMVYSTVKAHRGAMELDSAPGEGTRIRLRFPAFVPLGAAPASLLPNSSQSTSAKGNHLMHILLVDDDELIATSTQEMVELLGYTTSLALSGEEALAKLEAGLKADAVILDLNMPGLGGAGTLPLLRALQPKLPVLLATGRVEQFVLDLVKAYPGVSLMSKPFTMVELRDHLRAVATQ